MNRSVLGGIIAFALVLAAALVMTVYAGRLSSGHRLRQYSDSFNVIEERVDALDKQRLLLEDSAVAMEKEASVLRKRAGQIEAEIRNMRDLISTGRKDVRAPFYSLRGYHFTAASGLLVIAFLLFIWMLYAAVRSRGTGLEDESAPADTGAPVPGSLSEEEFPAAAPGEKETGEDSGDEPVVGPEEPAGAAGEGDEEGRAAEQEEKKAP